MDIIFADTSFLVAYYNADDENHGDAREFVKAVENQKILWVISDYIFDEMFTVLLVRAGKQVAIEVGKAIFEDVKEGRVSLVRVDEEIFRKAWEVCVSFTDKDWSFTDCTSYVLIKNLQMEKGASFDEHFKQFGIRVVP